MQHQLIRSRAFESSSSADDGRESDEGFGTQLEAALPALRAYARALSRSREQADDTVQDAMLKAWRARATYREGTNFKAWMFTILRNSFLSAVRRQKFEGEYQVGAEERMSAPANQLDHLTVMELRAAIGRLPEKQRETLLLVVVGGLSYEEAAEVSGCMVGTVKSRIGRARASLQQMLDGESVS